MNTPTRLLAYKRIGGGELNLHVFEPPGLGDGPPRAAIVFFFGGGWLSGTPAQFYPQCAHFAARGLVAMAAEYRVATLHGTSPRECVQDGRSCLRWIRARAGELHLDPQRLAAGGGSAGGHVAACTALDTGYDEPGEDTSISCRPDALVLFNPVLDNGPGGYGYDRVQAIHETFSPAHNLRPGLPPTLLMLGTCDDLIPVATLERYATASRALGNRCELLLYEGRPHGFFNYEDGQNPIYGQTLADADAFLSSIGLLRSGHLQDRERPAG